MLNIFNFKLNNNNNNIPGRNDLIKSNQIKHFSPAIKEWNNSVYAFNKNTLNLVPLTSKIVLRLVKSYFNIYNSKLESKIKKRRISLKLRKRRFSSHKIYISKGEFKHTNEKIIINIYIYNRQKYNYLYKIKKLKSLLKKRNFFYKRKIKRIKAFLNKKLLINKPLNLTDVAPKDNTLFESFMFNIAHKVAPINKNIIKFIKKSLRRHMLNIYYKRLLLLNEFKFKYTYLNKITNLIKKIYNKNIEFNIINLKYFYLNSDIFTESITNKITKNKKRLYRILKRSLQKVKISNKKWMQNYVDVNLQNKLYIHNFIETNKIKSYLSNWTNKRDPINNIIYNIYKKHIIENNESLRKTTVINSIKNKTITGVRLEIAGRLSKRHTASRSVFKLRYKGSLKNRDSSYKKLSSTILRGNIRTNLQYTKLNSIVRIGSFGIKGWISNN